MDDGKEESLELNTRINEGISQMSGCSFDANGRTLSLEASTTTGRSWGPHGDHTPDDGSSLRNSPDANLRLRFISGDQTDLNWILR